eukprot:4241326-Prymnesium_polylepis.1
MGTLPLFCGETAGNTSAWGLRGTFDYLPILCRARALRRAVVTAVAHPSRHRPLAVPLARRRPLLGHSAHEAGGGGGEKPGCQHLFWPAMPFSLAFVTRFMWPVSAILVL